MALEKRYTVYREHPSNPRHRRYWSVEFQAWGSGLYATAFNTYDEAHSVAKQQLSGASVTEMHIPALAPKQLVK